MTDRLERVPSLRALMLRWQLAGMLVGFALALLAAVLDARRNGPLSLQGNVLPMARLIAAGTLSSVPVSAMLCWVWVAAAQRVVVLEQRTLLRSLGLGLVGGLQALLCFVFGALLTGRFAEVWAITDRFAWLPGVPALVLLLWPIMAAWLLVPRVIVPALRRPLIALQAGSSIPPVSRAVRWWHVVGMALSLALSPFGGHAQPTASLRDSSLVITSPDLVVPLPPHWLGGPPAPWVPPMHCGAHPAGQVRDRIVIEPERLGALHASSSEWRRELAIALSAALPMASLVAYAGADPWDGACGAVQLRVHLLTGANAEHSLVDRIDASTRALRTEGFRSTNERERDPRGWLVERVRWSADRGDYVGVGTIEFWSRSVEHGTLMMVFHWVTGTGNGYMVTERDWIIDGIRIGGDR